MDDNHIDRERRQIDAVSVATGMHRDDVERVMREVTNAFQAACKPVAEIMRLLTAELQAQRDEESQ